MTNPSQQQPSEATGDGTSVDPSADRSLSTLRSLYRDQLRDIYSVESQLVPAFDELASMAEFPALRRRLEKHVEETRRQKARLEEIGRARNWQLEGDSSKAMEGLIAGGREHVASVGFPPARDFLIIAHLHRIKHYELAAYAVVRALAEKLGWSEEARLLNASRDEDRVVDEELAHLAADELVDRIPPS